MKISKVIETLKSAQDDYGDIDVLLASEPEGNSFDELRQWGTLVAWRVDGEIDTCNEDEVEEYDIDPEEIVDLRVIVLWP